MAKFCSRCKKKNDRPETGQRYCKACHAASQRKWRKTHKLTFAQRVKDNARSKASVYKKRGKIVQQPCEVCGSADSQMHHDDYLKPLEVRWFCRKHHLAHHKAATLTNVKHNAVQKKNKP